MEVKLCTVKYLIISIFDKSIEVSNWYTKKKNKNNYLLSEEEES